jgi:fatty acid desaturase
LIEYTRGRAEEATFIPEMKRWKVTPLARICLAIFAAVIAACLDGILPAMLIGLPIFYCGFITIFFVIAF